MNMIPPLVPPFGCRVLAGSAALCLFSPRAHRIRDALASSRSIGFSDSLSDHDSSSRKQKPFSKGASR